ncbi:MAG TPA: hypothetical protein VGA69_01030 [Nitriliruptorales bacterium]
MDGLSSIGDPPAELGPISFARAAGAAMVAHGMTQAELGRLIGVSAPRMSRYVRLLGLSEPVQAAVAAGTLSMSDATGRYLRAPRETPARPAATTGAGGVLVSLPAAAVRTARAGAAGARVDVTVWIACAIRDAALAQMAGSLARTRRPAT